MGKTKPAAKKQTEEKNITDWATPDVIVSPKDWDPEFVTTGIAASVTVPDVVPRMSYESFKDAIKALKGYYKEMKKLDDAIRTLGGSSFSKKGEISTFGSRLTEEYVAILALAVGDKRGVVEWWCWDEGFGKDHPLYYVGAEGREIEGTKALYALILELNK